MLFLFSCCLLLCVAPSLGELIKGVGSGKCLAVAGVSSANGAKDAIYPCPGDSAHFQWFVEKSPTRPGYYLKSQNGKKCFVVAGGSVANGAEIIQMDCTDAPHALWNFKQSSNGLYQIVGLGSNKCAAVYNGFVADGVGFTLWDCVDNAQNESFEIGSGEGDIYSKLAENSGGGKIKGLGSGKCIAVAGASYANGAKEVILPCPPDSANFQWFAEKSPTQPGYYLKSQSGRTCFAVAGGSVANGAEIIQLDCADAPNILWNFKLISNGHYLIIGLGSNKCVAVYNGSVVDGAGLTIWDCVANGQNELFEIGSGDGDIYSKLVDNSGSSTITQAPQGGMGFITYTTYV